MVKIGFSTDVETRRKQLSTTPLPYEYEIIEAPSVVTVVSERKVGYKDEATSLSAVSDSIK